MLEAAFGFFAEIIIADTARDDSLIPEKIRHISKVCWRASKSATVLENIPEQFTQSDRREFLHARPAFPLQYRRFRAVFLALRPS